MRGGLVVAAAGSLERQAGKRIPPRVVPRGKSLSGRTAVVPVIIESIVALEVWKGKGYVIRARRGGRGADIRQGDLCVGGGAHGGKRQASKKIF